MILIVGSRDDPHVASVVGWLQRQSQHFAVLDAFSDSSDGITYQISRCVSLRMGGSKVPLDEVSSIWWRQKPRFVVPTSTPAALYDYFFVHREWNHLIDFMGSTTSKLFSINDREAMARANNKIGQLQEAETCGLAVPPTIISNDAGSILDFISGTKTGRCIYKTLTPYMPPNGTVTYTSEISAEMLRENRERITASPGIFQEFIAKEFELRITVIGTDVFAARINSHHSENTAVDWRREIFADMYSAYEVGDTLRESLLALHRAFGLFYAAYDFIVDRTGTPVLLDVNPAGQWMWLETRLGFPIAERVARALGNPPTSFVRFGRSEVSAKKTAHGAVIEI